MSSIPKTCSFDNCQNPRHRGGWWCFNHQAIRSSWTAIKTRCFNPKYHHYQNYGGRGIIICERWRNSIKEFYKDIGDRPGPKYSIDRIDNDGNYSCGKCIECMAKGWPMNCCWQNPQIQAWNRSKAVTNKTGYIGVSPKRKKWAATINITVDNNVEQFWIGTFIDKEDAAVAYDTAVIFFRGDDGVTNIL